MSTVSQESDPKKAKHASVISISSSDSSLEVIDSDVQQQIQVSDSTNKDGKGPEITQIINLRQTSQIERHGDVSAYAQ